MARRPLAAPLPSGEDYLGSTFGAPRARHIIGLAVLMPLGWFADRGRGLAAAVGAVVVASIIGILIGQLLFAGELFKLGIDNYETYVP